MRILTEVTSELVRLKDERDTDCDHLRCRVKEGVEGQIESLLEKM